ncbi:MAG: aspartate-semialdehyde dehydrogenase [Myxococcales bacterium]|nr:aspartate-semialdehyde dehydrogenase [Myxococcales bacterium]
MSIRCAIVGATGIAGQQFLSALIQHPFFKVVRLAASSKSAGKNYREAIRQEDGQVSWYVEPDYLNTYADMMVEDAATMPLEGLDLVFSAVESSAARDLETRYAEHLPVISTTSAYRYETDVPIIIPAANGGHAQLIHTQRTARKWRGFVVPGPNCTTTGLAIALAPLHRAFGVDRVIMTSLQAVSGAGRSPGVGSMDIVDNIVPYIPNEEGKVERETQKILGQLAAEAIDPANFPISATCTRVPVLEAHTETVYAALSKPASLAEVREAMTTFGGDINPSTHPSAPKQWITLHDDPFRPQPRVDRDVDGGMTTSVGRLREETVLGIGVKFVLVSHNTKMGAAKGALLVAEDLRLRGFL